MKKQLISILTAGAMMAGMSMNAFAKNDFAGAASVTIGQPTTINKETLYQFTLTKPSFVVFNMKQADTTTDGSMISVYHKTNRDGSDAITGVNMKSAAILPAGHYYFESLANVKTDELTISTTALNTLPTLQLGKTYKGTIGAKDYLVYKYTGKSSKAMTLKSTTSKKLKAVMGINDNSLDTELDNSLDPTSQVSRYFIKGGTNYIVYTQAKAGAYSFKATAKGFKETAKETTTKNNDTYQNATALKLGKTYNGAVHFLTDVSDYYKLTLKKKQKVTVSVKSDVGNVKLYTKKGVKTNNIAKNMSFEAKKPVTKKKSYTLKAGTYYLEVSSGEGYDYTYALKVK
jgi:hypothetical protein